MASPGRGPATGPRPGRILPASRTCSVSGVLSPASLLIARLPYPHLQRLGVRRHARREAQLDAAAAYPHLELRCGALSSNRSVALLDPLVLAPAPGMRPAFSPAVEASDAVSPGRARKTRRSTRSA
jgi:hypothetical protein